MDTHRAWWLDGQGGLARRLQTRQTELDVVLQELGRAGRLKPTEIKGKLVVGLKDSR